MILLTTEGNHWNLPCGAGQMIRGFDAAVADMRSGRVVDVGLMPEESLWYAKSKCNFPSGSRRTCRFRRPGTRTAGISHQTRWDGMPCESNCKG